MEQRLQKVLAAAGVGSRRHCEGIIATGRVTVDGKVVTELGTKADPDKSTITVDGIPIKAVEESIYILLYKPVGYTSTRSDPHAEKTVLDLVKDIDAYLYPVGRLDVDTSGVLILTNDGDFTHLLTHPSHEISKTYLATVKGRITSSSISRLERGVKLEDGTTAPASARLVGYSSSQNTSNVEIIIHEGRKRQVRRMFENVGHEVEKLVRTRVGFIDLLGLDEGKYRHLSKKEVAQLRRLATQKSETKGSPGRR